MVQLFATTSIRTSAIVPTIEPRFNIYIYSLLIGAVRVSTHRGFRIGHFNPFSLHKEINKCGNVYSKTNWKEIVNLSKCKKFGQRSTANDLKPTQTNSDLHIQFSFRGRLSVRQRSSNTCLWNMQP